MVYEINLPRAPIGSNVEFVTEFGDRSLGEVVGINGNRCMAMPYDEISGINSETRVYLKDLTTTIKISRNFLGRVIDFQGNPIDGKGAIDQSNTEARSIYGVPINKDTLIDPNTFLHFEHTDGANFLMVNFIKKFQLFKTKRDHFNLSLITKCGAGTVIPRTDVRMFGNRINNKFHIAGVIVGLELGFRATFFKYAFIDLGGRGTYAYYINSLVQGKGNGRADHIFATFQTILTAGVQVKI